MTKERRTPGGGEEGLQCQYQMIDWKKKNGVGGGYWIEKGQIQNER